MRNHIFETNSGIEETNRIFIKETIQESRSMNNQLITHKLNLLEEMNQLKKLKLVNII